MNKNKQTSTPVVKNSGNNPMGKILKNAFPSSIEDSSEDESFLLRRPKKTIKRLKRQNENSSKKINLRFGETSGTNNINNSENSPTKNLENVFIEKMQEMIKSILSTYPEITKAVDTQNHLIKSLGKHQSLIKENIVAAMKHNENINNLQMKIGEERKMFDKFVEAANNE